jgi:hypothetical protein
MIELSLKMLVPEGEWGWLKLWIRGCDDVPGLKIMESELTHGVRDPARVCDSQDEAEAFSKARLEPETKLKVEPVRNWSIYTHFDGERDIIAEYELVPGVWTFGRCGLEHLDIANGFAIAGGYVLLLEGEQQ